MNRRLQYLNLFGVVALALLCAVQWQRDRQLNLATNRLETTRQNQQQIISEQEKAARGLSADLAQFKEQSHTLRVQLDDTRQNLRISEQEIGRLARDRDQLKESLTNWIKAVTERDERLIEANARISELAERLNDSIRKFNQLATNYNAVVIELNAERVQSATNAPGKSVSPRP